MMPVALVRHFNRFYTQKIGALDPHHLDSPYSLTEVRVLYELAHTEETTAADIAEKLGLDAGYLSRILARFAARRLIGRKKSPADARQTLLSMSERGRAVLAPLETKASDAIAGLLSPLAADDRDRMVAAMRTIESALGGDRRARGFELRDPQPGDMGWVIERHAALYSTEYGFDHNFEALVAGIVAAFMREHDPERERAWIAVEDDDVRIGCIFLVRQSKTVAKLRLFLVEPSARGRGVGRALTDACVAFAREAGYRKITLWTDNVLLAARHIYESAGFRKVAEERNDIYMKGSVNETWELDL